MGSGGGRGAPSCSDVLAAGFLRAAVFLRVVAFLAAGFLRAAVFLRVVAFLAAGFLRAAVFLRVVAFLAAGFLRAAVFLRVVAFLAAGFLRAAVFLRVVAFLAAGFLRAAVFFRVVAFLAAGFLRAAVFFRVVAFLAAGFLRAAVFFRCNRRLPGGGFLRVALLVLLLLAGIAITFLIVGISPFILSRRGEVPSPPQRTAGITTPRRRSSRSSRPSMQCYLGGRLRSEWCLDPGVPGYGYQQGVRGEEEPKEGGQP